ncbi:protein rep, partial [Salmonella enterica subsp. enterica serovar Kentucky]|uniref:protein rep n=1 Tax=Salmonella enterica TaxID=28901 RepID=UPI003F4B9BEA
MTHSEAHICRVRHTPLSQRSRSKKWQDPNYQTLPRIVADNPDARWKFMTLTVRTSAIGELGEMLNRMKEAYQRMKVRKEFMPEQGWIRTTQVTRRS